MYIVFNPFHKLVKVSAIIISIYKEINWSAWRGNVLTFGYVVGRCQK